ncbi:MAG: radical SAM protein, partial [Thermoleophilaceae bacterium]
MRWDNLKVESEEHRRLPGYAEPAAIRTFDAPEALDTRFYEVQAKSVLNRVPERSRMPFRWTINPYRGCSHACTYCMSGDTLVLMADGRTKPLEEVRAGDRIYG